MMGLAVTLLAPAGAEAKASPVTPSLPAFRSCQDLLTYARAGATRAGGTTGVPLRALGAPLVISRPSQAGGPTKGQPAPPSALAPTAAPATSNTAGDGSGTPTFSTTNNQEDGVDEPDVVKTDGRRVYVVTDNTLRIVDVTGARPVVVGTLALEGYGQQLLLRGKRLLVSANAGHGPIAYAVRQAPNGAGTSSGATAVTPALAIAPVRPGSGTGIAYGPGFGQTLLTEVDVSDPSAPKVARAMTVDGDFVGARLHGGTARVIIGSAPDPIVATQTRTLRQAIAATTTKRFIPGTVLRSKLSGRTFRRPIAKCSQIRHPRGFSGTGLLTVMTIDLDRGLYSVDRDAVMAGAQTVYGSPGSIYVASQRYSPAVEAGTGVPSTSTTQIARFDASEDGVTTYRSSGEVPGFVLNQYSLSEYDGRLRVASTLEPLWFPGAATAETQSSSTVSVLQEQDGKLATVGQVDGLGKGERIYAVRFVGDAGYVVTFRQVDPLYVVDLSTPTAPRVRGELKLTGYSAYLHPLGDNLLLGVGQEATPAGRVAGSQVSLFDVSDPTAPKRLSARFLGQGNSTAEFDPHAFLYWAPTKLAVLPLSTYDPDKGQSDTGAVALHVTRADGITDAGRIEHSVAPGQQAAIDRSLVIGDSVYSVSYAGLGRNRLDTLAPESFTPFAATP
jgi:uncharacterized secreted protein with C-terminal beta-propeller domain